MTTHYRKMIGLGCLVVAGSLGMTAVAGTPPSLAIDDTHGHSVLFSTTGITGFGAALVASGAGYEVYQFGGDAPFFASSGGGAAILTEPGNSTQGSDALILSWQNSGHFVGEFASVDAGYSALLGPLNPSWALYQETGLPVAIPNFGFDPYISAGSGGAAPMPITIASSIPDAGSTTVLMGMGLATLGCFRRKR